jgi:hypothetical protein
MDTAQALARAAIVALLALVSACALQVPRDALLLSPQAAEQRERQTRKFDGVAEKQMLAASAAVLQDLGFTIDEGETALGLIVASKERSAINKADVAGAYLLTALSILALTPQEPQYAKRQLVRVALVTSPVAGAQGGATTARVTMQRLVYDNHDRILLVERVDDADLYREFFDRLSQSLYLEAQTP